MKSSLFCTLLISILLLTNSAFCQDQTLHGFSYQAVARSADGDVLKEESLTIRFNILNSNDDLIWEETHEIVTNEYGLFSAIICQDPEKKTGGSATSPSKIEWGLQSYFMQIEIDYNNNTILFDKTEITSVPYALNAVNDGDRDSSNELQDLTFNAGELSLSNDPSPLSINIDKRIQSVSGWIRATDTVYSYSNVGIGTRQTGGSELSVQGLNIESTEPLFEVKRNDGVPVFAVYNDGVMVFVDEQSKGLKGGFAVGGYNSASKGITQEYMRVTDDSVRIWVRDDDQASKGLKGGFAVGGYTSGSKDATREFLRVTDDSTRIYVDQEPKKGIKGGFAVGGYTSAGKSPINDFMTLTPENYFIGHESGESITTGTLNAFVGFQSGKMTQSGSHNVFFGPSAGKGNQQGSYNVAVGSYAGELNNGDYNVMIGYQSGQNNIAGIDPRYGNWNNFIGYQAGNKNTIGWHNLAIGYQALLNNAESTNQFAIGDYAGQNIKDGHNNTFLGHLSGMKTDTASENTFIGYQTGYNNTSGSGNTYLGNATGLDAPGSGNVFIGNRVGWHEQGSNLLYIDNGSTTTPLVYGNFETDELKINGSLAVTDVTGTTGGLTVRYNASNNLFYYYSSSEKTKENIQPFKTDFHRILDAQPVSFTDIVSGERHIGFIAEEFEKLGLEQLVIYVNGEPAALSYELISLYNLEIIKEQQEVIRQKDERIIELEDRIDRIEQLLEIK